MALGGFYIFVIAFAFVFFFSYHFISLPLSLPRLLCLLCTCVLLLVLTYIGIIMSAVFFSTYKSSPSLVILHILLCPFYSLFFFKLPRDFGERSDEQVF